MNIIHIITTINRGGAENQLIQMLEVQKKKGINLTVIFLKGDCYWKSYLNKLDIKVYGPIFRSSNYLNIFNYKEILSILSKVKKPIIHAHMPPSLLVVWITSFFMKNKSILYTSHNDEPFINFLILEKFFVKIIFSRVKYIVCISSSVKKFLINRYNVTSSKLFVISYGFNKSIYGKSLLKKFDNKNFIYKKSKIYIGTVARLEDQKRLDLLIKAFSHIREIRNNVELVIIGRGSKFYYLKKLASEYGIENYISWVNYTDNVLMHMKRWSVFCLTSEYEGFGLVLLEAIYAKLPIVAMDVSSIKEIIGRCGEVSKFGDLRIFVKNVFKVLNNRDNYNLENYLDKFSMGINFEKYYEIYQKCN